ncbi:MULTISPECIES: FeoA family protein [Sharpea]|uniref:Ferrous iron transport protein A n=1 Tax=Sharpea azabuensis TaxID=322505 RepID=A0A1H6WAZ2_9FIRM|nr:MULTISPECIES: FeoA family protein [Sharpea]HAV17969.1 ferrous iron transport protein A [Erysipelotrichaceae bacterium]MDD6513100.1 FeoA family protein [Sharpea azabuensis]MDY5278339.1 FeoA family protein [Sharpea porci]MEE3309186.1 FeoA family protein [Sharpea azabuensis]SEJ12374.1 ferrous iron transport protein A [Sharpea azabuensis]
MFPLTMAKVGEKGQIKRISGKDEVKVHLAELGFVVNNEVTVVNRMGDNLIVQVHDSRIAIDSTLAKRIFI